MLLVNQIEIMHPPDEVFEFLSAFENIPLWNYYVIDVSKITARDGGEQYYQKRRDDFQIFEVVKKEYPKKIKIVTIEGTKIQFKRLFQLRETPNSSCILTDRFELDLGISKVVQQIFSSKVKRAVKENLGRLKELIETGQTVLQDGRVSVYESL